MVRLAAALCLSLASAQELLNAISSISGYFTGREPENTMLNQIGQMGQTAMQDAADNLRGSVQSRALVNSNILRNKFDMMNRGGANVKDLASQTYLGAGLLGASEGLLNNFLRPVLPNLNMQNILGGEGPMRSLANTFFRGLDPQQ